MSVIPYNQHQVVYHDPDMQVAIVHDRLARSVRLVERLDPAYKTHSHSACPQCGYDLNGFFEETRRGSFGNSRKEFPEFQNFQGASETALGPVTEYIGTLGGTPFMHRDYFKLLAGVNQDLQIMYDHLGVDSPGRTGGLPPDLFNQGYFDRFFQKVSPFVLGSGAHGDVYKVQHVLKNTLLGVFAVKRINVGDHSKYLDHVLNEVLILYELSANGAAAHNLIRYNHVWMEMGDLSESNAFIVPPTDSCIQFKIPYVYILQQYCAGGNLDSVVAQNFPGDRMSAKQKVERERRRRKGAPRAECSWFLDLETWKFARDISVAVKYLHENQILHRDLKPPNCLLETEYSPSGQDCTFADSSAFEAHLRTLPKVLVSDFGEGKLIDKTKPMEDRMGNTGTIEFSDPKLWIYDSVKKYAHQFTYSCDMYSLGLIVCYLCVGSSPFSDKISGMDDPEAIRKTISEWYENLDEKAFSAWLKRESFRVRGSYLACIQDVGALAYDMLVGQVDAHAAFVRMDSFSSHFLKRKQEERKSVLHIDIPVYILVLVLLETADNRKASYVWKLLKVVGLIGLLSRVGALPAVGLLVVTLGAMAHDFTHV